MLWFSLLDAFWLSLALIFLIALCAHRLSAHTHTDSHVYHFLQDLIRYGKTKRKKRPSVLLWFDVPKRWFWHFYLVSVLWSGFLLIVVLHADPMRMPLPAWLCSADTPTAGPALSLLLTLTMVWLHSVRRLLECVYLSVFSHTSIHLLQYTFGLIFYLLLGVSVLCAVGADVDVLHWDLYWFHILGLLLFFWASWHQHHCLVLLARLRTGRSGEVVTLDHKIPHGDWFQFVSCPHYLAELLIYVSFSVCCGCWCVCVCVFFNQLLAAHLCHDFYRSTFVSYPKNRKALIPYLI